MANIKYTDIEAEQHAKEAGVPPRPKETKNEIDERGAFVRQANSFIIPFGEKEGEWKAEAGRYRIYWAKGCNWSNRPVIARDLLGLKEVHIPAKQMYMGMGSVTVQTIKTRRPAPISFRSFTKEPMQTLREGRQRQH